MLERVAHRYRFDWLGRRQPAGFSCNRIHLLNARCSPRSSCSRPARKDVLAEMYAIGLLASFCINIGCLLIYRYFQGTKRSRVPHLRAPERSCRADPRRPASSTSRSTNRTGRALGVVVVVLLAVAIPFSGATDRAREVRRSDTRWRWILALGTWTERCTSTSGGRERSSGLEETPGTVFVTFFNPRQPIPTKLAPNHFRFPIQGGSLLGSIEALLALLDEELAGREVYVHFGWRRRPGSIGSRSACWWRTWFACRDATRLPLRDRIPAAPRGRDGRRGGRERAVPLRLERLAAARSSRAGTSSTFTGPPWLTRSWNCGAELATRLTRSMTMSITRQALAFLAQAVVHEGCPGHPRRAGSWSSPSSRRGPPRDRS